MFWSLSPLTGPLWPMPTGLEGRVWGPYMLSRRLIRPDRAAKPKAVVLSRGDSTSPTAWGHTAMKNRCCSIGDRGRNTVG